MADSWFMRREGDVEWEDIGQPEVEGDVEAYALLTGQTSPWPTGVAELKEPPFSTRIGLGTGIATRSL